MKISVMSPKVVHYNRLKLYEGRNPSVWFRGEKDAPLETTQDKASQTNATTDRTDDDMEHAIDTDIEHDNIDQGGSQDYPSRRSETND